MRRRTVFLLVLAASVTLAAAPKKAATGERVLEVERGEDGRELSRFVQLADGGAEFRFPDGGTRSIRVVRSEPGCSVDEAPFVPLTRGCKRSSDCDAVEPHVKGVSSCVVVTGAATTGDAYSRALAKVIAGGRMPDGGPCANDHVNSHTIGGCEAVCVKGVCVQKEAKVE